MQKSKLVGIVVVAVILLIGLIVVSIRAAPVVSFFVLITVVLSIGFMMTEDWLSHNAIEYENRFWSAMAFVLACSLLFCPDSPFRMNDYKLAAVVVFFFTYFAHLADRYMRNIVFNRIPNLIRRIRSADFDSLEERMQAHSKVKQLEQHLTSIDNPWISSTFMNMFAFPFVLKSEHDIINIFLDTNQRELNFIVQTVSMGRIMYKVKDHKIFGIFNRTTMLELLAVKRIKELTSVSKAYLLHGFQNMKLSAHPLCESYVKSIILSTALSDLSELKSLTDSKGDVNSMHKLIYADIREKKIKMDILNYIAAQARIQDAHKLIGSRKGRESEKRAWRKIVSDIDDTLMCSGGSWPAGIDPSYPKHTLYPGVLAFYRELDLGVSGNDEWDDTTLLGNLVFLSARPHVYKSISEDETYSKFRALKVNRGFYTSPTLLAGGLDSGTKFVLGGSPEPIAQKKFEKFSEYLALYPEYKYVFIGDNGQGDARTVEMLLENATYRGNLDRAYIHEVQPVRFTYAKKTVTRSSYCSNIYYFRNYVDAALDAYGKNLIRLSGLRRIMMEAVRDFELIQWNGHKNHDTVVPHNASSEVRNRSNSDTPKLASTSLAGHQEPLSRSMGNISSKIPPGNNTQNSSSSTPKSAITTLAVGLQLKKELKMRDLNLFLRRGNQILATKGLADVPLLKYSQQHATGDVVKTKYGRGIVTRFRPLEGLYEVLLQWDNTGVRPPVKAVLQSSAVAPIARPPAPKIASAAGSKSMFRTRSLSTINLAQHIKTVAFAPPSSVRSQPPTKTAPKGATPVAGINCPEEGESFSRSVEQLVCDSFRQCSALSHTLPKPADWIEVCSQATWIPIKTSLAAATVATGAPGGEPASSVPTINTDNRSTPAGNTYPLVMPSGPLQDIYGALVWTTWGIGWVVAYREVDDMVQVSINFGHRERNVGPVCWLSNIQPPVGSDVPCISFVPPSPSQFKPLFAKCFVPRNSIVQLTDPLLTQNYQEILASYYCNVQFQTAYAKLEERRRQHEQLLFTREDSRQSVVSLKTPHTPPANDKRSITPGTNSPSRLAAAAISTMRVLGIIRPAPLLVTHPEARPPSEILASTPLSSVAMDASQVPHTAAIVFPLLEDDAPKEIISKDKNRTNIAAESDESPDPSSKSIDNIAAESDESPDPSSKSISIDNMAADSDAQAAYETESATRLDNERIDAIQCGSEEISGPQSEIVPDSQTENL